MASTAVCGMSCNVHTVHKDDVNRLYQQNRVTERLTDDLIMISHELHNHFTANTVPWAARCAEYVMKWK